MGLAANVMRRGGVYWWRGRFAARSTPSRVVARSLRTRDPDVARVLGSQVTGLAVHLRQSVRQGVMTIEEAEGEISSFLTKSAFSVHPKVIAQLEAEEANPRAKFDADDRYSAKQETAMLSDFVRRTLPILERQTAEARAYPLVVLDGVAEDWVAQAIRSDRLQAEVSRLLAVYGGPARVGPEDRAGLLASGWSENDVAEIERQLLRHAALEVGTDWKIGPERDVLVFHLQAVGAVSDDPPIRCWCSRPERGAGAIPCGDRTTVMPNATLTDADDIDVDAARLIELLWQGWLTLLDRYDGRDTAVIDPVERLRVLYELHAKGLLLCSVPAPTHHAVGRKAVVAAWLRDHGRGAWTAHMAEAAIVADTEALQPANDLPVRSLRPTARP